MNLYNIISCEIATTYLVLQQPVKTKLQSLLKLIYNDIYTYILLLSYINYIFNSACVSLPKQHVYFITDGMIYTSMCKYVHFQIS
jgi:hypothetical protein